MTGALELSIARRNAGEPTLIAYADETWAVLGSHDLAYEENVIFSVPLQLLPRNSEWQLIESAPKDCWILAAEAEHPDIQYSAYAARWHSDGYWMANCGQNVTETPQPTRWMPLPAPPETSS